MPLPAQPRTWTTGELVSAAHMNTEIRDALKSVDSVIRRTNISTGVVINTVFTNILQVTIPIPSWWVTYDVEAYASCYLNDTSGATTGTTIIQSKVVHQTGDFNLTVPHEHEAQNNHDNHVFAQVSYVEGLTTSGNRTFTWQMLRDATNATSAQRSTLIVKAFRVT